MPQLPYPEAYQPFLSLRRFLDLWFLVSTTALLPPRKELRKALLDLVATPHTTQSPPVATAPRPRSS